MSALPPGEILLVEDDEAHTELIRRSFEADIEESRFVLHTAGSLAEARATLEREDIDLLLADFMLPDGRGIELLQWEQVDERMPVVVLTSHGDETVAVEAMKSGALDYVVKSPETFNEMPHIVSRSLREWGLITEQKRLELELRQSQKLEAVGRLSSGIAHDFNNLLMAIIGCSQLALRKLEDDHPARKFVEAVRDSANRGSSLSKQLVTFSRKTEVAPEVFELNEMLRNSRRLMQPLVGERINFKMRLDEQPLHIVCDRSQLEQVVLNLIVNARDAMPEGGDITLATGLDAADEHATMTVRDTGVGMAEETQVRAFEPFFTTKPVGKGTGLGLSTVYGIIKQAGGDIAIDSEVGRGTAIEISLPLAASDDVALSEVSELPEEAPAGTETVLLIEDDELVRLTMASYLQQGGYTVIEADQGDRAIEIASDSETALDLIVSDVMLPGTHDGPSTVAEVLKLRPDIPAVLVSAHSAEQLLAEGRVTEAHTVLRKPIDDVELLTRVRKALDAADSQPAGHSVLFVEDHELSRTTSAMLMADAGYVPVEAATGGAALRALQENPVDIVIVDLGLPDTGGAELVQKLRAVQTDLPALFVSGRDETDPAVRAALELPRTSFLPKPYDFEELEAALEALLDDGRPD